MQEAMTGNRIYNQVLGWDFSDFRDHCNKGHFRNPHVSARKKWSKKIRARIKNYDHSRYGDFAEY